MGWQSDEWGIDSGVKEVESAVRRDSTYPLRTTLAPHMFWKKAPKKTDLDQIFGEEALIHADALFGAAMRLTKSQRDAEDLVQDALLKAYVHFDKYQPGTNCKAWLFKILTNTFINRYRKKQRERTYLVDEDEGRPLAERIESRPLSEYEPRKESERENIDRLFGDEVGKALLNVPVDFRMAVMLADVYDFSYKECAEMMGCPIGTVMSRLYRGRRMLRSQLAEYAMESGYVSDIPDEYREQIAGDRGQAVDIVAFRRAHG